MVKAKDMLPFSQTFKSPWSCLPACRITTTEVVIGLQLIANDVVRILALLQWCCQHLQRPCGRAAAWSSSCGLSCLAVQSPQRNCVCMAFPQCWHALPTGRIMGHAGSRHQLE